LGFDHWGFVSDFEFRISDLSHLMGLPAPQPGRVHAFDYYLRVEVQTASLEFEH